jgi:hypothetical protein
VDEDFPLAEKIILVIDHLNMHSIASLYETFPAEEAKRIKVKLEIHDTPKHGSWLNMAERELSGMTNQCFNRRIDKLEKLSDELGVWQLDRNTNRKIVTWQFTTEDARIKLKRLYLQFE